MKGATVDDVRQLDDAHAGFVRESAAGVTDAAPLAGVPGAGLVGGLGYAGMLLGCERIMRFAFDLARTRAHKKVSSVTKSSAQR